MKKTIRMTEGDLSQLIKRVIMEEELNRESDLKSLIHRVEKALDIEPGQHQELDSKESLITYSKTLLKKVAHKALELKKLEVELRSSTLGIGLTVKKK
jgi:hypothetical protein